MEQLVALLLALAALDALAVHLLGHLLVADLLLLGRPALLDLLDAGLGESAGKTQRRKGERKEKMSYLALGLLLLLHLALALLDGGQVLALLETLRIRGQAGAGPERLLGGMPILACGGVVSRSAAVAGGGEKKSYAPFFLMPTTGAGVEEVVAVAEDDMVGSEREKVFVVVFFPSLVGGLALLSRVFSSRFPSWRRRREAGDYLRPIR